MRAKGCQHRIACLALGLLWGGRETTWYLQDHLVAGSAKLEQLHSSAKEILAGNQTQLFENNNLVYSGEGF